MEQQVSVRKPLPKQEEMQKMAMGTFQIPRSMADLSYSLTEIEDTIEVLIERLSPITTVLQTPPENIDEGVPPTFVPLAMDLERYIVHAKKMNRMLCDILKGLQL